MWGVTFIFVISLCFLGVRFQIKSNDDTTLVPNIHPCSNLESVLIDLNISMHDAMPTKSCAPENRKHQKTIVIVPLRNRTDNLKLFISPLHQHLMNQVSTGCIF